MKKSFAIVVLLLLLSPVSAKREPSLSLHEAELLVYLTPDAHAVRQDGFDVAAEFDPRTTKEKPMFFVFWVGNPWRKGAGSVTVGFYFVNRYTGEIWEHGADDFVRSPEINGAQKILREAHKITDQQS